MAIPNLTAKPLLTFRKKIGDELRTAPDQAFADNPNTVVISMAGGDLSMGQFGEQPTKAIIIHPVIFKEYQHIHITQIKARTDFFTEGLIHFVRGFKPHIPIVVVLSAQIDSETGTQLCIYNLLELCRQFVPAQVDCFIRRHMSPVKRLRQAGVSLH
ncbi:hypothetical protein D7V91_15980 [bacterium 1xD42-67]|nr:hypothetical protein D7V91_15980 [bacterium 1xD42-67]